VKFGIEDVNENLCRKSEFDQNGTKISGTSRDRVGTLYCFRGRKFAKETFLFSAQYFFFGSCSSRCVVIT